MERYLDQENAGLPYWRKARNPLWKRCWSWAAAKLVGTLAANIPHPVAVSATIPVSCAECCCNRHVLETVFGFLPRLGLRVPCVKMDEWLWIFHQIGSYLQRLSYCLRWLSCFSLARTLIAQSNSALHLTIQSRAATMRRCRLQPLTNNEDNVARPLNYGATLC